MANKTEWAHLPNARHIDWVLDSLKASPHEWDATRDATWDATWVAAWDAAWGAAWDAAWGATRDAAWVAAWVAVWGAARDAARGACAALIAWDDSADVLLMPVDAVRLLDKCGDPRAVLLLPAVVVRNKNF